MKEFVKGWRRKTGLVTLVMACGLMTLWIRSQFVQDALLLRQQEGSWSIVSAQARISFVHHTDWMRLDFIPMSTWNSEDISNSFNIDVVADAHGIDHANSHLAFLGFSFGDGTKKIITAGNLPAPPDEFQFCIVPYWLLILPLTLISARLILEIPCSRKSRSDISATQIGKNPVHPANTY